MHSAAAAPRLTVSCKISTAKPFIHFRQRPPVLQKILGRQLTRDAHKAHWTSTPQRGELVRGPSLHLQRYDTESLHLASGKSRGSQWCPPYRDSLWSLAETPYFVELARMGRKTVLRSQAADFQQKRQLQDVVHGPGPSDGQVMLDAGRSHAEESKQASDISEQANKMPATKHIHLEARLAIFQKDGNLEQLTVAELRGILKLRNRPSTGRKQDLLQELKRVLAEPAELGGAEKQLKEIEETKSSKLLTSQDSEMLQQRRPAANATVLGEDTVEGSMIKVYRSRRAKAHNINAMADTTAETQPRAKRTRTAGSGEPKDVSTEQTEVKKIWATFNHKKPQPGWYAYDPSTMRPAPPSDRSTFHKLISWNVNGIRALLKGKDPKMHDAALFRKLAEVEDFDVLCLQETKLQDKDVDNVKQCLLPHYEGSYWSCSTAKLGYSGTAIISRVKPLSVDYGLGIEDHDKEGRLITAEFETFYLVTSYVPNSGDGLRRLDYRITGWDPALSSHVKKLEKKKPVILTGDLNCCHEEMDIADPNANRRSAGFTDEERTSFAESYLKKGLVDTFRRQHPNAVGYTYWGYRTNARARNHGWRLDYFLASEAISDRIHDSYSMPHILGSDHCPIGLILRT